MSKRALSVHVSCFLVVIFFIFVPCMFAQEVPDRCQAMEAANITARSDGNNDAGVARIWHGAPYAQADIDAKALKGFLWAVNFMRSDGNLKGNENNYLNFLRTVYRSARDPALRSMAREEAARVVKTLIADGFISRYTRENDYFALIESLSLVSGLQLTVPGLKEAVIKSLEKEKDAIIERVRRDKQAPGDADSLYETMLVTYYITSIKHDFPEVDGLRDMPDLRDFFDILGKFAYHREHVPTPDISQLTRQDKAKIADDLYNITHVIIVVSDYSSYRVPSAYFRREIDYMLKFHDLVRSRYHDDPDLLSEIVYVLSLMGYSRQDPVIKEGWMLILGSQKEDGGWEGARPDPGKPAWENNYNIFHTTWTALDVIIEPVVLGEAPFYEPLKPVLEKYGRRRGEATALR